MEINSHRRGRYLQLLNGFSVPRRIRVPKYANTGSARKSFFKKLKPLGYQGGRHIREASDVAPGSRQALHQTGAKGISYKPHNDRD
jgi:hypothetical protein